MYTEDIPTPCQGKWPVLRSRGHYYLRHLSGHTLICHDQSNLLCPKSPSKLWPRFRSSMQSSTVFQPGSDQPIMPRFIIPAYLFISPFLIPFPHTFHVSDICFVSCSPSPIPDLNPKPQSLFHSTSHHISLVLFLFPLLFPTLCPFPMTLICSLR